MNVSSHCYDVNVPDFKARPSAAKLNENGHYLSTISVPEEIVGTIRTLNDPTSFEVSIRLKPLRPKLGRISHREQTHEASSPINLDQPMTGTSGSDALLWPSRKSPTASDLRVKDHHEKDRVVLKPLPSNKGASSRQRNMSSVPGRVTADSQDSLLNGLDVEPNGMEVEEDEALTAPPQFHRVPNRRTSRCRRSAIYLDDKGAQIDFGLGLQGGGDSVHEARRKEIARSRWVKAIWYASEEAHRRRAERKALLKNLGSLDRAQMRRGSKTGFKGSSTDLTGKVCQSSSPLRNRPCPSPATISDRKSSLRSIGSVAHFNDRYGSRLRTMSSYLVSASLFYVIYGVDWYIIAIEEASKSQAAMVHSLMVVCFFIFLVDLIISLVFHPAFKLQWNAFLCLEILVVVCSVPDFIYSLFAITAPSLGTYGGLIHAIRLWKSVELSIRVGTRASRAIRVMHLFNTWRVGGRRVRASNAVLDQVQNMKEEEEYDGGSNAEQVGLTSIGVVLENTVSCHHILIVGVMLLSKWGSEALMLCDRFDHAHSDLEFLLSTFRVCNVTGNNCQSLIPQSFARKVSLNGQRLLFLKLNGDVVYGNETRKDVHRQYPYPEVIVATFPPAELGDGKANSTMHLLNRKQVVMECWAHTMEATVLILFLLIFTTSLSTMIRSHIISPLKRIVKTVLALEVDPLRPLHRKKNRNSIPKDIYEVSLIENALHKIAALMQLGFGEAGANIIQENMRLGDELQVNSEVAGKVVHAIFGFCDIRNFTDCTEVLQVDVVKLVNGVASIVHESVVNNLGAPNKNIGDAFLLVWKPKGSHSITKVAESALRSYIRIIIEISRCKKLERWAKKKQIQARMPGFQLKMGFGMHYGWAIEGAIGSLHKIDASYLSPHVNIASRLESATKQFGVYILFSEDVYTLLSFDVQNLCRSERT
uniref:Guanylate cyclase domain-containing protein n=1 Tax=Cryptomonas curvata TaxID=233186 RepID=A0A7S0MJC3_9CRYP|mmetsp:Transcript_4276/g.9484  ORF Transcript_4276/g.9484 Transcript_4276/m.9484 type:complete len:929 (+) Transcript_4276:264-3050(+)